METSQITAVSIEECALAKQEWRTYLSVLKQRTPDLKHYRVQYKALKNAQYYLSKGKSILDLLESMRIGGVNAEGLPKLAISRADFFQVRMRTSSWPDRGSVVMEPPGRYNKPSAIFRFPVGLFGPDLKMDASRTFTAAVPTVPARLLPVAPLKGYYLLWEVEKWAIVPPKDPLLLRRLAEDSNLFVVLAHWDLTPLERAVMRGAIG